MTTPSVTNAVTIKPAEAILWPPVVVMKRKRPQKQTTPAPTKTTSTISPNIPPSVTGTAAEISKETYTISVEPPLRAGHTYILEIPFKGEIKDSLYGFYRSSYKDKKGMTVYVMLYLKYTSYLFGCYYVLIGPLKTWQN
jgi:hypothetical protein